MNSYSKQTLCLVEAIYNKNLRLLQKAIMRGALINTAIDRHQLTPLHYAVLMNFPEGVKALLNAGANEYVKSDLETYQLTPWEIACLFEYMTVSNIFNGYC